MNSSLQLISNLLDLLNFLPLPDATSSSGASMWNTRTSSDEFQELPRKNMQRLSTAYQLPINCANQLEIAWTKPRKPLDLSNFSCFQTIYVSSTYTFRWFCAIWPTFPCCLLCQSFSSSIRNSRVPWRFRSRPREVLQVPMPEAQGPFGWLISFGWPSAPWCGTFPILRHAHGLNHLQPVSALLLAFIRCFFASLWNFMTTLRRGPRPEKGRMPHRQWHLVTGGLPTKSSPKPAKWLLQVGCPGLPGTKRPSTQQCNCCYQGPAQNP